MINSDPPHDQRADRLARAAVTSCGGRLPMLIGYFGIRESDYGCRHGYVSHTGRREEAMVFPRKSRVMIHPEGDVGLATQPPDCIEPDYDVILTESGQSPRCGCGWKVSDTEDLLYLDSPILPAPILCRLLKYEGCYELIWERYAQLNYPKGF
jgi:hypothetical protein